MPVAARPARFNYFIFDNVERKFIRIHDGFIVGRNEGDLQFPSDDVVSRRQCRFSIDANDVYIEDLGSTNHTKINTVPITSKKKRRIQLNDVIEFGKRRFILTNQNKHEPSNFEDVKNRVRYYKAIRKSDGNLTSHISRLITMQTKVLLSRGAYNSLRVKEFSQLKGWDSSTTIVLISLVALWSAATWFFATKGAFAPGLAHSAVLLGARVGLAAIVLTMLLTLGHYLAVRKRFKSAYKRIAFVPIWLIVAVVSMPLIDIGTSVVSDAAENVVELNCVKRFQADTCRPWAKEDSAGFKKLPRDQQEEILSKLRATSPRR